MLCWVASNQRLETERLSERKGKKSGERTSELSESGRFRQVTPSSRLSGLYFVYGRGERTDHHPGSVKLDHS